MQEQLNRIFGFCTLLYCGLLGYETVSTGSFDASAVRYYFTLFLLYPNLYSALATVYSSTAALSLLHALLLQCRQVMSQRGESTMSSPFRKGYSPFNGEPNQYHGWMTLQRSVMYEDGLGIVMSGVETAPVALEEDATQLQRTQYAKETLRFEENGKLFARMLLDTADSRDGYAGVAAQVVQAYAPVGTAEFGDHGFGGKVSARW